jgi:hypothetical protein
MKKISLFAIMLFCGLTAFSQAVADRNVIPVAVNLNQVLRMTITNGGNIEFVFNTIDDYKNGLTGIQAAGLPASGDMYQTDFTVASSTRWKLTYGAEEATFIGTDNPGNSLALDNVGFSMTNAGAHTFNATAVKGATATAELFSGPTLTGALVAGLQPYPIDLIEDNDLAAIANAGDATDNAFTIYWRCGTEEDDATVPFAMNALNLLDQSPSPTPDRYVANVLFELSIDN